MNQKFYSLNFIFLFSFLLFSLQSKAIALATLPSTLSDTCVEINLKSGSKIIAKITKKTQEKVYFKKCDNLADTTSYFVLQEKIDNIKTYDGEVKEFQEEKEIAALKRKQKEDKIKQNHLSILLGVCILSCLILFLSPYLSMILFTTSSIWGLIEVISYKGSFQGKGYFLAFFILANLLLLLMITLIANSF